MAVWAVVGTALGDLTHEGKCKYSVLIIHQNKTAMVNTALLCSHSGRGKLRPEAWTCHVLLTGTLLHIPWAEGVGVVTVASGAC